MTLSLLPKVIITLILWHILLYEFTYNFTYYACILIYVIQFCLFQEVDVNYKIESATLCFAFLSEYENPSMLLGLAAFYSFPLMCDILSPIWGFCLVSGLGLFQEHCSEVSCTCLPVCRWGSFSAIHSRRSAGQRRPYPSLCWWCWAAFPSGSIALHFHEHWRVPIAPLSHQHLIFSDF